MTGPPAPRQRLASIDWMRGIVMILMVVDHASLAYNGNRFAQDSAGTYVTGTAIPPLEFWVRWASHLCAPAFLFLAGTALALSIERRLARGMDPRAIDRDILLRGLIIFLVDPVLISFGVRILTFQVMYAIGVSMMAMALLRRLPSSVLVLGSVGWLVLGEIPTAWVWDPSQGSAAVPAALLMAWHQTTELRIIYPALPWLSMLVLGWVYGRHLLLAREGRTRTDPPVTLMLWGAIALASFALVRSLDGYGNMFVYREGASVVQWLHVSKYPPSLAFSGLELGVLFWLTAGLMWLERRVRARPNSVLLVFGQTAFFFYVVHRFVFDVSANWFGLKSAFALEGTLLASAAMLLALYPLCLAFRRFKRAHPDSWLRFF